MNMDPKINDFPIGTRVLVRDRAFEGSRTIIEHLNQNQYNGGVTLDRPVHDLFIHWNIDELIKLY